MGQNSLITPKFISKDEKELTHFWQTVFLDDPPNNAPPTIISEKLAVDDAISVCKLNNTLVGACWPGYVGHKGVQYAVEVGCKHRS